MLFSQVEEEMVDTFINEEIPKPYQDIYRKRLQEGKDDSLEGQILSVADKIDLLYETFGEIQNVIRKIVFEIYEHSLETIMQFRSFKFSTRFYRSRYTGNAYGKLYSSC